jgi:hypothetical protein
VLSGFLPRFVFVTGAAEPRPLVRTTPAMVEAHDAVIAHAQAFYAKAQRVETVQIDDDVLAMHWAVEQAWMARARSAGQPELLMPSLQRLSVTVLKMAALIAIDEWDGTAELHVRPTHFSQAFRMAERWLDDTLGIVDGLDATTFMRDTEAILATIRQAPGVSRNELSRRHRRVRSRDFDEALATLAQREQIVRKEVETTGRPRVVYFPVHDHSRKGEDV